MQNSAPRVKDMHRVLFESLYGNQSGQSKTRKCNYTPTTALPEDYRNKEQTNTPANKLRRTQG